MGVSLRSLAFNLITHAGLLRNLFATRGRKLSTLQHSPLGNPSTFAAAALALCIGIFFHYVPWLCVDSPFHRLDR